MKPSILFVPFLLAVAACSSTADDNASAATQASSAVTWEAAIRCDGAVLDVNRDERRELQLVINDHEAIEGLTHSVDLPGVPAGTINEKGEFILAGRVEHGVFHANDFSSATVANGSSVRAWVGIAGDNEVGAPGAGGSGDPTDLLILFGEYTNWRFRNCHGEI